MAQSTSSFSKVNPNEYGIQLYDAKELIAIKEVLKKKKIFRYSTRQITACDQFETEVRNFLDVKHALALNNGTSALKVALHAVGVQPRQRVLISAYTFIATAAAVVHMGGVPVPIDFDFEHGMDLTDLEAELKKGCAAVMPVHLQGRCFNLHPVIKLAKKYHVPVIEDACQALGAKYRQTYAGCFGDVGVYSFQQNKLISCGEGGLMVTKNAKYDQRARIFADHGMIRERMTWDDEDAQIGDNYRMNNFQAAILLAQLQKIPRMIASQTKNREYLLTKSALQHSPLVINSADVSGETGMNILLLLSSPQQVKEVVLHAKENNIEVRSLWPKPYYLFDVMKRHKLDPKSIKKKTCLVAEDVASRLVSVSVPPTLTKSALHIMAKELQRLHTT